MTREKTSNRTVNTKRNSIYGLLQVAVSLLFPFIVRTILIYRFGEDYLGLNSLFSSILGVLSLMELGFSTAVVYSLYKPVAYNDIDQICAFLAYYKKIYRVIGLAVMATGLLLMPFLKSLIHDSTLPNDLNLYVCYLIFLGNAVISYLFYGYLTIIPTAYQRKDILSRVDMGMTLMKCSLQVLVLFFTHYFYLFFVPMLVVTVLRNLIIMLIVKTYYPDLKCKGTISKEQKKDLTKKVYGLLINKLTNVSRNSIDYICISAFIGLSVTGRYANYFFVLIALTAFSITICNSMMASVGNSIAIESRNKNYIDMRLFDYIYMAISGWATVCLVCLYQPFISTWLGDKMLLESSVAIGLSAYFYILKAGDIRWVYHEGAGLWYECRFIMLGEVIANIILNIVLCKLIVLATLISVFATNCLFCPWLIFNVYFKNKKLMEYWSDHACYAGTMIISCVLSLLICKEMFYGTGIAVLTGRLIVCSVTSIVVFWLMWNRSNRYKRALQWMKGFVNA